MAVGLNLYGQAAPDFLLRRAFRASASLHLHRGMGGMVFRCAAWHTGQSWRRRADRGSYCKLRPRRSIGTLRLFPQRLSSASQRAECDHREATSRGSRTPADQLLGGLGAHHRQSGLMRRCEASLRDADHCSAIYGTAPVYPSLRIEHTCRLKRLGELGGVGANICVCGGTRLRA